MLEPRRIGFRAIKATFLDRIQNGTWGPGALMPKEITLAEEFGCARATVNRALQELADEGFIERKRKAGTRVRKSPLRSARFEIPLVRDEVEATGATYRYRLVSTQRQSAPDWLCARLNLALGAVVVHTRCMHFSNETPFQFEDRWINCMAVPAIIDDSFKTESPNEWLVRKVPFSNVEISFFAEKSNQENAEFLQIPVGEPIFATERVTWHDGKPVTFARMYFQRGYRVTTRY